jgi:hypothetical protein
MPIGNTSEAVWTGWLIDDYGEPEQHYAQELKAALEAREIPNSSVRMGTTNMWWRPDSIFIDVASRWEESIPPPPWVVFLPLLPPRKTWVTELLTIHVMKYGTRLFVARASVSRARTTYGRRMASTALLETVDRCIRETTLSMVAADHVHSVRDEQVP